MNVVGRGRLPRPLLLLLTTLGLVVATAVLGPSAQSEPTWPTRRDADLTATAIAGPKARHAVDLGYRVVRVPFRRVKADATANASATCDGCSADAAALQILYLDGASGSTVDNVATAWSRCARCRATALAVQVVVVRGRPSIRANNRALAVNGSCRGCHTWSAAFQVIVASDRSPRLSAAGRSKLRAWVHEQADALRGTGGGPGTGPSLRLAPRRSRAVTLRELDRMVNQALGTTTLERSGRLQRD